MSGEEPEHVAVIRLRDASLAVGCSCGAERETGGAELRCGDLPKIISEMHGGPLAAELASEESAAYDAGWNDAVRALASRSLAAALMPDVTP